MKTQDSFYFLLEKIFIEKKFYQEKWFLHASSSKELCDLTQQHLELCVRQKPRSITDEDVRRLLNLRVSYVANYNSDKIGRKLMTNRRQLPFSLTDSSGRVRNYDLAKLSHLIYTDSRAIIASLLREKSPEELKFVLMSTRPERFSVLNKIRTSYIAYMREHDINEAIISTTDQVINVLNSLMGEVQMRIDMLTEAGFKSIEQYNAFAGEPEYILPYIVVIMDDFSDFIQQAGRQIEKPLALLSQSTSQAGIHFILATTHPIKEVITDAIKKYIPKRITSVSSVSDEELTALVDDIAQREYSGEPYTLPYCKVIYIKSKIS